MLTNSIECCCPVSENPAIICITQSISWHRIRLLESIKQQVVGSLKTSEELFHHLHDKTRLYGAKGRAINRKENLIIISLDVEILREYH